MENLIFCKQCKSRLERKIYTFETGFIKAIHAEACDNLDSFNKNEVRSTCLEILALMCLDRDLYEFSVRREDIIQSLKEEDGINTIGRET